MKLLLFSVFLMVSCAPQEESAQVEYDFPFLNPSISADERAADIVSRLTIEEKALQLFNKAPAIERLGIPAYNWWNEALHGVARAGKATVFPQAIGLAATFDEALIHEMAIAISDEARAKHHRFADENVRSIYTGLTFWSPNINIFRDPRWGRGQETYGEDPFLTGRMAVNFIKGLQGDDPRYLKTIATAKHYGVHSGPEVSRHTDNIFVNDRDLYETYLPAFKMAVEEGQVASIMCAYNRFRDQPCCGSDLLLQRILREDFGFEGYVVTDCGAVTDFYQEGKHNIVERPSQGWGWALSAGTDLNCEESFAFIEDNLDEALEMGMINETDINRALTRLFKARIDLGMFDPVGAVPYADIPYEVVGSDKHLALAEKISRQSLVLLKNDGLLPLKEGTKVALIGPNANNIDVLLGNYNGNPINPITPLKGLTDRAGAENVTHAVGSPLVPGFFGNMTVMPEGVLFHRQEDGLLPGLKAKYYKDLSMTGTPDLERIDDKIDFVWTETPISGTLEETFAVAWQGVLKPIESGAYQFRMSTLYGNSTIMVNGEDVGADFIDLRTGREYDLEITYSIKPFWWGNTVTPDAQLTWVNTSLDYEAEALAKSKNADVIVFCGGISPRLEGEEMKIETDGFADGDRTHLKLPEVQESLLKKLHATGKPVIYVNFSGSAIALNWQDAELPAIVQAFYPGEPTGKALAGLLFGDYSPSGRLPVTFYKSVEDLPDFLDYAMNGRTYRYFEDEPLYTFGHGLSYTSFGYDDLVVSLDNTPNQPIKVSFTVTNTGDREGTEVVQLYLSDKEATVPVPLRSLVGFKSLTLQPGESRSVSITIDQDRYAIIDKNYIRVIEPGWFSIAVGGGQPQSTLNSVMLDFELKGELGKLD